MTRRTSETQCNDSAKSETQMKRDLNAELHEGLDALAAQRASNPLFIWAAVAPDDSIIAAPFDTEQQVHDWVAICHDPKYRDYRPVKFVPADVANEAP